MCGIYGLSSLKLTKSTFNLDNLKKRGRDGLGVYTDSCGIIKNKLPIKKYKTLMGNTRAIPTTEFEQGAGLDIINQQPFENERFVVVHNGIISNDNELRKKYNIVTDSKVDTSILPTLFKIVGVVEGIKLIKGSYAILCVDKQTNKFYAAKNFMPLRMIKNKAQIEFFSLKHMSNKESVEVKPYTILEISNNDIVEYKIRKERNNKVLVICSGGIDSVTTAYLYKYYGYEVTLLHFKYGQAAQEAELFAVEQISKDFGTTPIILDAIPIFNIFKSVSKLLSKTKANKEDMMLDAESTLSYVPNRNAIFSMIACGVAEMHTIDNVTFGGQQMDSVYPDNNNTFVNAVHKLLPYSLNWNTNIKFTAPLINLIKHEVIQVGKFIGVPYDKVCSCYYPKVVDGNIVPCQSCGCCQFRMSAFKMCGFEDKQNNIPIQDSKINLIPKINMFIRRYIHNEL